MKRLLPILLVVFGMNIVSAQKTALHFDGVDDYIPVTGNSKVSGPSKITLESWIYVTNFNSSPCADCAPIIWQQDNAYRFGVGNTSAVHFQLLNGSSTVSLSSGSVLSANLWHHIAGTFDGSKMKIYIDGVCTDSNSASFSITYKSSTTDVWIADPATGYGGILEETRIWNYARTKAEIKDGMYRRYSSNSGLVLAYGYEDGIAYKNNTTVSKIDDASINSNDGTPKSFKMQDSTSNFVLGRSYCDTIAYAKFSISRCVNYTLPSKKRIITTSGDYKDTIMSYRGCDSVMTISVKILKPTGSSQTHYSCDSFVSPNTGKLYKFSGKYQEKLKNSVGCDSIISLNVFIIRKDTIIIKYANCVSVVLKNGKTVFKSGLYIDSFKNFRGCDSFIFHSVVIKNPTSSKAKLKFCKFVLCPSNTNKVFRSPGIFYDTLLNKSGCDSIIEYEVVSKSTKGTINVSACSSFKSPSKKYTYTNSGTYYDTLVNRNSQGCDSFITINLTIMPSKSENINITNCFSYTAPSGRVVTQSRVFYDTLKYTTGCDSVIYSIHVIINNVNAAVKITGNSISAQTANGAATFQWLNCDQNYQVIMGEKNKQYMPVNNGRYAVSVTENNCVDTSDCLLFEMSKLKQLQLNLMSIQPNPSNGKFSLKTSTPLHNVKVNLVDVQGKILKVWELNVLSQQQFDCKLSGGLYYLKVESSEGQNTWPIVFE
jgi:hypothetical protein